jgi:hypothetical protein
MLPRMTHARSRGLALAMGAVVGLWPAFAVACPACVGSDSRYAAFLKIGSLFILVPFAVLSVVLYVLRQAPERDRRGGNEGGVKCPTVHASSASSSHSS